MYGTRGNTRRDDLRLEVITAAAMVLLGGRARRHRTAVQSPALTGLHEQFGELDRLSKVVRSILSHYLLQSGCYC